MAYDEVEIEDMKWDDELQAFTYACPCGDVFSITTARCRCMGGRGRVWRAPGPGCLVACVG